MNTLHPQGSEEGNLPKNEKTVPTSHNEIKVPTREEAHEIDKLFAAGAIISPDKKLGKQTAHYIALQPDPDTYELPPLKESNWVIEELDSR